MERLSVIIPAYNEEKYISGCLESLARHAVGDERLLEVIVVNNASTDKTADVARRYPFVKVVNESRKGITRARQKGYSSSEGEILAYLDADTQIGENWLDDVCRHFVRNKKLVCVSGPVYFFDATPKQNRTVHAYWSYIVFPTYKVAGYMVVGGNFAVRRSALEKIGGFDISIAFYGEDANLARRLNDVGKVLFDLKLKAYSSNRRLKGEGLMRTGAIYVTNYLSEALLKHPITKRYNDIR